MKKHLFAVLDVAANCFGDPMCFPTTAMAIRAFKTACQDPNVAYHHHPTDYSLYQIAEFDIDTGHVEGQSPTLISKATDHSPQHANGSSNPVPMEAVR